MPFINQGLFELETIKDLSQFSFSELSQKIINLNRGFIVNIVDHEQDTFLAVFESASTKLEILYTKEGSFIKKINEFWK
jgi:hypothetical protein